MAEPKKRLGDAELEIMKIIWRAPGPVTSTGVLAQFSERGWKLSTLMTTLARLCEKGFIYCDRSTRTNYYTALISEDDYKTAESRLFLKKLYGGSLRGFVAELCELRAINDDELEDLWRYLGGLKANRSNR
jgi:BlaI family penicillinase repressor